MRNVAIVWLPLERLKSALNLPEGARIIGLRHDASDAAAQVLSIKIEHPDLPGVPEGTKIFDADLVLGKSHGQEPSRIVVTLPDGEERVV
jgi:hypothetical protein